MAQFDVHVNKGRLSHHVPFFVTVQSSRFDDYSRRIVVPLARMDDEGWFRRDRRLRPAFHLQGLDVMLHPLEIVSLSRADLGTKVDTLKSDGQSITDALDEVFTRSWG